MTRFFFDVVYSVTEKFVASLHNHIYVALAWAMLRPDLGSEVILDQKYLFCLEC